MAEPSPAARPPRGQVEDLYPLSPMQEGMLFHALYGESDPYYRQLSCRLEGPLDVAAFEAAWQRVVDDNPILRTAFFWRETERPLQAVYGQVPVPLHCEDWRGLEPREQSRRLEELLQDEARRGFDPTAPPLLRLHLLRFAESSHHFVWSFHHLLLDGWSVSLVLQQAVAHYRWAVGAADERPPEPGRPYRDYVAWLRRQDRAAAATFWRRSLAGFEAPTPVPLARPAAAGDERGPRHLRLVLPAEVAAGLAATARRHRLTVNTLVQGAWALLLQRLTGEADVVFGATTSGRPTDLEGFQRMVGLFINTLPVRTAADPGDPLAGWLARLQAAGAEARQFEFTPLLEIQGVSDVPRGLPLFQTLLVFENYRLEDDGGGRGERDFAIRDFAFRDANNFPLTLTVRPGLELALRLSADPALLGSGEQERLLAYLETVLRSFARGLGGRVGEVEHLPAAEVRQLLHGWNPASPAATARRGLAEIFAERAAAAPDAVAVVGQGACLTYGELVRRAARLAARLAARGVGPEELVAVCTERTPELVVAVVGVLWSGAAYLPLDPTHPRERQELVLGDAAVRLAVVDRVGAEALPPGPWELLEVIDRSAGDAGAAGGDAVAAAPAPVSPDRLAYVIYTSGSTGTPKGVAVSQRAVIGLLRGADDRLAFRRDEVWSLFHTAAFDVSVWETWGALVFGGRLVVAPYWVTRTPRAFLDLVVREQVTILSQTPSAFQPLLREAGPEPPPALTAVVFAGEALDPAAVAAWQGGPRLVNMYGITETTVHTTYRELGPADVEPGAPSVVGGALPHLRLYVVDAELRPVPAGVAGELLVGGDGVARGYRGQPALTAARFVPDPFSGRPGERLYRSGDLARWLVDGDVEYLGRIDHQVKVRGFRVEPGEIETVLTAHPAVREAVVLLRGLGEEARLAAYLVAEGEVPVSVLREHAAARLPAYMLPADWVFLERLPLTANGKVDRRALPAPGPAESTAMSPPETRVERVLARLWEEILKVPKVGLEDDFFALGGHSLLAMRLAARVRQELGVELLLRRLFSASTLADQAREITRCQLEQDGLAEMTLPVLQPDPEHEHVPFPLTEVQQAYWLGRTSLFELGGVGAHGYSERDLRDVDLRRLEAVIQRLVARHGMLRMVVLPDGRQKVLDRVPPFRVPVHDLRSLGDAAPLAAQQVRQALSHEVRPSERWPLLTVRATLLPGGVTRLHFSTDALVADAWAKQLLFREGRTLYLDLKAELPAVDLSFRDYVLAVDALEGSEQHRRDLAYWRDRLPTLPPAPELPLAVHPSELRQPRFERRRLVLEPARWKRLKQHAGRTGLTPSALLLAAWSEILAAWSKSAHFTLNLTLFNRLPLHPHVDRVVGDFTTLTLVEVDNRRLAPFEQRARAIQEQLWDDLQHRTVGGVWVLRELARMRREGPRALMPVVFTSALGLGAGGRAAAAGPAEARPAESSPSITQTPQVWIDHQANERGGALVANWDSPRGLFPAGMLDDMFAAYRRLLEDLAEDAGDAWTREILPLLPEAQLAERAAVNATARPLPDGLLHGPFLEQARRHPQRLAVIHRSRTLTYGELLRLSTALAHRLRELGARPGGLVAVVMDKGWEQVVAVLAALQAGAPYLPLEAGLPEERLRRLLEVAGVEIALVQSARAGLDLGPVARLEVDTFEPPAGEPPPLAPCQAPDDLAYVIFTSGSTGFPKGVMIEHRAALNTVIDVNREHGVGPGDRVLALSSLGFDLSVYDLFGLLAAGGAVVVPEPEALRRPERWLELVRLAGVTVWNSVPALMELLVDHLEREGEGPLSSLRLALLSGDWVPVALPERTRRLAAPGARVIAMGGATEAAIWSIRFPVERVDPAWRSIPYGRPMANQGFHVLDERLEPRPVWVPGDLFIAGAGLARGYLGDGDKTARSFLEHPRTGERLYRTGDLGRYLPGGDIEFLGREDGQVKVQGYRIELGEIDTVLEQHPAVRAAAAVAVGEGQERRLLAFVVPAAAGAGEGGRDEGEAAEPLPAGAPAGDGAVMLPVAPPAPATCAPPAETLDLERLSLFLTAFRRLRIDGFSFPKALYASAGDLYPVRTYLVVEEDAVPGLAGGSYYHHPLDHSLVPVAASRAPAVESGDGAPGAGDGVTVVWTGHMDTVAALYPSKAGRFVSIEAGEVDLLGARAAAAAGLEQGPVPQGADGRDLRRLLALEPDELVVGQAMVSVPGGGGLPMDAAPPPVVTGWTPSGPPPPDLDDIHRLQYRMSLPALREVPPGVSPRALPEVPVPEDRFRAERSHRRFLDEPLSLRRLGHFLAPLRELAAGGGALAIHLHVLPSGVEGLAEGLYAYCAEDHRLVRQEGPAALDEGAVGPTNRPIFASARAILIFTARDDGRFEVERAARASGACCQALRMAGTGSGVGLCPIGDLDPERLQPWLGAPHRLVHGALLGGVAEGATNAPRTEAAGDLPETLRRHLSERLPGYMVPGQITTLEELPLSANGKVDRAQLAARGVTAERSGPLRKPRTRLEKAIAEVWKEVLGVPEVGLDSGFFELGGTSILMVQAHVRLRKVLDREITLVEMFFEHTTVEALAQHLEASHAEDEAEPQPAQRQRRTQGAEALGRQRQRRRQGRRSSQTDTGDSND